MQILLHSKDEFKLRAVVEILQNKLVKRNVPLKGLTYGEVIASAGSTVRQEITALPATPGNIAKANVTVPAGFRKVPSSTFGGPVWPYFTSG